jgi:hypothetical protein
VTHILIGAAITICIKLKLSACRHENMAQNIIFTKLKIIQTCGLWGEDFKYISQSETGIVNGSNVFARSRLNGKLLSQNYRSKWFVT